MRVLHLVQSLNGWGIAESVRHLTAGLEQLPGVEVDVALLFGAGALPGTGIRPHRLDIPWKYSRTGVRRLSGLLARGRYEVVHAHGWPALLYAVAACGGSPTPVLVATEHNVTNRRRRYGLRLLDRALYRRYQRVVAVSGQVSEALAVWLPETRSKTTVVRNGVDPELVKPSAGARGRVRQELELQDHTRVVLALGRLERQKGIDVLLRAMPLLNVQSTLLVAGTGALENELESLARRLGLTIDAVRFLGFRTDVPDLLAAADVLALPSRWEGCPMTVLEAMACGVPVVASQVGGVPELVETEGSGLLVPPGSPRELALALDRVLGDPQLAATMGVAGKEKFRLSHQACDAAVALAQLYQECLGTLSDVHHRVAPLPRGTGPQESRAAATAPLGEGRSEGISEDPLIQALSNLVVRVEEETGSSIESHPRAILEHRLVAPFVPALHIPVARGDIQVPEETAEEIAQAHRRAAALHLVHHQPAASRVVTALTAARVPTVLLKGIVLSELLYPSLGARPMVDVDLMVPRDRVQDAVTVLEELGYEPDPVDEIVLPSGKIDTLTRGIGCFRRREEDGDWMARSPIDLHWDLVNVRWLQSVTRLDQEELFQRALPFQVGGVEALRLHLEDQLLHLCYHQAVKHHLGEVRDYLDIDLLWRLHGEELDGFPDRAREARLQVASFQALWTTRELFSTPIPESILDTLRPGPVRRRALSRLASSRYTNAARGFLLNLLMVDRFHDLLEVIARIVWPDRAWLVQRYSMDPAAAGSHRVWHLRRLLRYLWRAGSGN